MTPLYTQTNGISSNTNSSSSSSSSSHCIVTNLPLPLPLPSSPSKHMRRRPLIVAATYEMNNDTGAGTSIVDDINDSRHKWYELDHDDDDGNDDDIDTIEHVSTGCGHPVVDRSTRPRRVSTINHAAHRETRRKYTVPNNTPMVVINDHHHHGNNNINAALFHPTNNNNTSRLLFQELDTSTTAGTADHDMEEEDDTGVPMATVTNMMIPSQRHVEEDNHHGEEMNDDETHRHRRPTSSSSSRSNNGTTTPSRRSDDLMMMTTTTMNDISAMTKQQQQSHGGRKRNSLERRQPPPPPIVVEMANHPITSATSTTTITATDTAVTPPAPMVGRKTSSTDHPTIGTSTTPTGSTGRRYHIDHNNNHSHEIVGAASQQQLQQQHVYASPKLSPNSYLTMDGRFVQSKNPFSSPMIMNNYHSSTTTTANSNGSPVTTTTTTTSLTNGGFFDSSIAPSLPAFTTTADTMQNRCHLEIGDDRDSKNEPLVVAVPTTGTTGSPSNQTYGHQVLKPKPTTMSMSLPVCSGTPVTQATVGLLAFSFLNNDLRSTGNSGGRQNNYICSPIPESPINFPAVANGATTATALIVPTGRNAPSQQQQPYHPSTMMMMTETDDVPTAGSLHKVRRIHRTDDVFAASNHHVSNLRHQYQQHRSFPAPPTIETTKMMNDTDNDWDKTAIDDISPTDVMSLVTFSQPAFFAPTPVVPKHGPPPTPMKQPRSSNLLLFSSSSSKMLQQSQQRQQYTPYTTTQHHAGQQTTSPRSSSRVTSHRLPTTTPGPPPTVTRKLLPRTPLISLLSAENHHPDRAQQQQQPYWQQQQHKEYNDDHPNSEEEWMFESDTNSCGYMTNADDHHHHHHSSFGWDNTHGRQQSHRGGTTPSRFHSDFDVIGKLGQGSFGSVFKVLSRLDGCMYAIKAAKRQAKGIADRDRMLKEVYALAALSDQADTANFHIVRYHQAWMEDDRLYIQTELCSGTLSDEMSHVPPILNVTRRYKLLREILLALDFIHRHNMVHLDIKPDNIFIKNDQYKLGDFGLVTKASCSQEVEEGDSRYMSMELLSGDNRGDLTKSDIFSLGITMYEICLGRQLPMNGEEWQDIRAGKLSPLPNTDHDMANIIKRMLDPNPMNRPTPASLLKHPQLLSDEEKALNVERTKVIQANIQLTAAQQQMQMVGHHLPFPKRALTRANTWSGSSLPYP